MGTLVGAILERLVGGKAVDPHVINPVRNQWRSWVGFELNVITGETGKLSHSISLSVSRPFMAEETAA
uniref:Uncharacterized protein n=1 Tax=Romanomermis culicivorax TaxID=13658 RepID=A0A915HJL0_ROMCU